MEVSTGRGREIATESPNGNPIDSSLSTQATLVSRGKHAGVPFSGCEIRGACPACPKKIPGFPVDAHQAMHIIAHRRAYGLVEWKPKLSKIVLSGSPKDDKDESCFCGI